MDFTTETVEVEEVCEDGVPNKKLKKVVEATFDSKYIAQFAAGEAAECIEIEANGQKETIEVVKTLSPKPTANTIITGTITTTTVPTATIVTTPVKNSRSSIKRQIRVMDPNLPAFVCTEHNENITLDCRYCRIASGFKKKNSAQKNVQNNEISSSGKVTVAIPKPRETNNASVKVQIPPAQKVMAENKEFSKEEIFGRYVASELKRIKSKKTYEEVKWKILQALQAAAEKEADDTDAFTS